MDIRVGYGFDVHQLKEGRKFYLGGIQLDYHLGPDGHSDADVLLHAICDSLLGAANMRDIGFHFSNTNSKYKNIDSKLLLNDVVQMLKEKNWRISNIDATVVLENPKINPHIEKMQTVISNCIGIEQDRVSIKATTNEKLGFIGREEGVTASAVALIIKD
jgi:2-C-methyl-D-erythritol 2,4-cyclodiphosphate synthase